MQYYQKLGARTSASKTTRFLHGEFLWTGRHHST
jgi:hypothetical protein